MVSSFLILVLILYSTASVKFSGNGTNNNNNNNSSVSRNKVLQKQNLEAKRLLNKNRRESVLEKLQKDLQHINNKFYYDNCRYEKI